MDRSWLMLLGMGMLGAAAAWRVMLLLARPSWDRWWFATGQVALLGSLSTLLHSGAVSASLGVISSGILVEAVAFTVAGLSVSFQMGRLRGEERRWRLRLSAAAVVLVCVTAGWVTSPLHGTEWASIRQLAGMAPLAVAVFCVPYYLFLGSVLVELIVTFRRLRTSSVGDLGRFVGLTAGMAAGWSGLLVICAMSMSALVTWGGADPSWWESSGRALVPVVAGLTGLAVMCVLCLPAVEDRWQEWRIERAIDPLWRHLIERHPDVALDVHHRDDVATRKLIEVMDGLARTSVRLRPGESLAAAIRRGGDAGGVPVPELLDRSSDVATEIGVIVRLGRQFRDLGQSGLG